VDSERTAVYVGDGLIARDGELYRRLDPHNAFCSVRESWTTPVTCWSDWHNRLPRTMPALVLRGQPGWLQVVHGGNVSNRVRGRRTRPSVYRALFPGLLDALPEPSAASLVTDILMGAPSRAVRETGRAAAKAAVGAVLGRRGLDRAKVLWASTRRAFG
jgi:putative rhamnosyltransferase